MLEYVNEDAEMPSIDGRWLSTWYPAVKVDGLVPCTEVPGSEGRWLSTLYGGAQWFKTMHIKPAKHN